MLIEDILKTNSEYYYTLDHSIEINKKKYKFIKTTLDKSRALINKLIKDKKIKNLNAVYLLKSFTTGELYIGSTNNVKVRLGHHHNSFITNKHKNPRFRELTKTLTPDYIDAIIVFIDDRETAFDVEDLLLDKYSNDPLLMNIATDARVSQKGRPLSKEHKQKLSEIKKKIGITPENRAAIIEGMKKSELVKAHVKKINAMCREPISINGVVYESVTEAKKSLKINSSKLNSLIKKHPENCFFLNPRKSSSLGKKFSEEWKEQRSHRYKKDKNIMSILSKGRAKAHLVTSKKVCINGIKFDNTVQAAQYFGVTPNTIRRAIKIAGVTRNADTGYYEFSYARNKHVKK